MWELFGKLNSFFSEIEITFQSCFFFLMACHTFKTVQRPENMQMAYVVSRYGIIT